MENSTHEEAKSGASSKNFSESDTHREPQKMNPWLAEHMPPTLAIRAFNKWLKDLPISEPKPTFLTENITKTETWRSRQPAEALETVERVAVMMGIPVSLLGKNYEVLHLLRAMTAAISLTN